MNLVADSVCQPAWRVWDGPFTSMCVWWLIDSEVLLCHGDLLNNLFIITVASRYLSCSWLKVLYYNILRALVLLLLLLCSPRISMTCSWLHQRELQEWIFLTFFFLHLVNSIMNGLFCFVDFQDEKTRMVHCFCHCCNVWFKTEYLFNISYCILILAHCFILIFVIFVFCLAFSLLCCFWRWVSGFVQFAQHCL